MAARAKAGIIERPTVILRTILQRFSELQIRDVPAGILLAFSDASPLRVPNSNDPYKEKRNICLYTYCVPVPDLYFV